MDIVRTIKLPRGRYVLAVSGGVDSMVLLDILARNYNEAPKRLTVAHFDHGIRPDSSEDRYMVQKVTANYGLPFVYHRIALGPEASEATARQKRYEFLETVRRGAGAEAIITAHHLDDALETAIHNILRGTGRKGLSGLASTPYIKRPLLHLPKAKLLEYAYKENLFWREDVTNQDTKYLRNYIRHKLLKDLRERSPAGVAKLKQLIKRQSELNMAIDEGLTLLLHQQLAVNQIDRHAFIMLPHKVAVELLAHWLRLSGKSQLSSEQLEKATRALKTASRGTTLVIDPKRQINISSITLDLINR